MIPREIHVIMHHGFTMEFHVFRGISTDGQFHGNPCDYAAMEFPWNPWKIHVIMPPWNFHGIHGKSM
jgi:hypothetical protein